jgi:predicted DNA-binding protein
LSGILRVHGLDSYRSGLKYQILIGFCRLPLLNNQYRQFRGNKTPLPRRCAVSDTRVTMSDMASDRITIRVPASLAERLRSRSRLAGRTGSRLIREALESYLGQPSGERAAYEVAVQAGLIGCARDAPRDLSSNRRHFDGFGTGKNK